MSYVQLSMLVASALSLVSVYYIVRVVYPMGRRSPNMPPGPSTIPILGNAMEMPRQRLHLQFSKWARVYGDVFSLKVFNQTIIVINSPSKVREILDKHSLSSSNRPMSTLADMITPNNMNMGTGQLPNASWKAMRRASSQLLNSDNIQRLGEYQRAEATQLMWDICQDSDSWFEHVRRYTTSFILGVLYGSRGPLLSSPDVADFMDVHPKFMAILEIGTAPPVDIFPILKLVPEQFAPWKMTVKTVRYLQERLFDRLLSKVENRLENGQRNGALLEEAIVHAQAWGLTSRDHLLHLGGTLLEGSDTCSAALQNAIYALTIFPEIQHKLHSELDDVVGRDRVPEWDDLPNLPYLKAFIEECNRYRPIGPLGLPHAMSKDEVIDGYLYPKDAVIFTNIYGMFHDERYFDRPEEFIPERFLEHPFGIKKGVDDDPARRPNMLFGAGRRVCPGIVLAKATLEINIANFAWGFKFLPSVDAASGVEVYPSLDDYAPGITATPQAFPVHIFPRSEVHLQTIQARFESVGPILASYELDRSSHDAKSGNGLVG